MTKDPNDVLVKTISENEATFKLHTFNEYMLSNPIYIKISTFEYQLSISFEEDSETFDFSIDDTVVDYKPELLDLKQLHKHGETTYSYEYLGDYVSVGVPTERYKYILSEAARVIGFAIDNNSFTKSGGYTWINAMLSSSVKCNVYSHHAKDVVPTGLLKPVLINLKSSVIGVGHFGISVMKGYDKKYIIKFTLNSFQLKDKTQASSKLKTFIKVEPPEDVITLLKTPV